MTIAELLVELSERGVQLSAKDGNLNVRSPKGAVTAPLHSKLMEHKAELLQLLTNREGETSRAAELPQIVPAREEADQPFPLTDIQQAYWIGSRTDFELGNVSIHFYSEVDCEGLDVGRLEDAWRRVVDRHGMLRAVVLPDGTQRILNEVPPYEVAREDLSGLTPAGQQERLAEIRHELSHARQAPEQWPDFELRVAFLGGERSRLHISVGMLFVDGPSLQVVFQDLHNFYRDSDHALPPLDISFRDYVLAEQKLHEGASYQASLEHWKKRVAEIPPAPQLPLAVNPATLEQPNFVHGHMELDGDSWHALREQIRKRGVSEAAVFITLYGEALATYSRSRDLTLNVTLFNRLPMHPQVRHLVGDFTSMVLVDLVHQPEDSFETRVRRVQRRLWEDLEHRQVSGVQALRELARLSGSRSRALMPVIFTFLDLDDVGADTVSGLEGFGTIVHSTSQTPQVYLDHQVKALSGGLVLTWDGLADLFPQDLLNDVFGTYRRLLLSLREAQAWEQPPGDFLPEEQELTRLQANATQAPLAETTLWELFRRQVEERPEALAVSGSEELTYGELARRSSRVAGWLREQGARPETLVAIVMDKGWEQVVAALAIHEAGAAYLPIDPAWPRERRDYLIENGGVEILLNQSHLEETLEWPEGVSRLAVDGDVPGDAEPGSATPARPDQLAYVIFTSGSTGKPKGVAVEHRGAVNTILDINRRFGVAPGDRVFGLSALTFDLSVYDLFGTLAAGATLVLPEPAAQRDPARWAEAMTRHGVTVWNSVPALLGLLLDHADGHPGSVPQSVRLALLSGDWLPLDIADRLRHHVGDSRVISLGGATEGSIWSIAYEIEAVDPAWKSVPYGRPLANQTFHVLTGDLRPRPVWVPGELYIGGVGVAREYWRDEEKTAGAFVIHPETGERLYRTGDLGRYLPDGNIEFLGREDNQVKIQGHRIELGEIEAALAAHPALQRAVVGVTGERFANRQLVAYVVPAEEGAPVPDPAGFREFLSTRLPAYMVPNLYVVLAELPLSSTGKVDRKALPAPEDALRGPSGEFVAPRDTLEEQVAAIWCEALNLERLSVEDNLIDYGGNSLTAIQVNSRLQDSFGVKLPLRSLLDSATVAGLAAAIRELQGAEEAVEALPRLEPDRANLHEPFPLNDMQQAYWMGRLETFELGNVAAHSYFEVEVPAMDMERMNRAWRALIDRHDMLRAVVRRDGRQQILADVPDYQIELLDLRESSPAAAEEALQAVRRRMSHQVLPADRWPLFEFRATRIDEQTLRFHFSLDLLIVDAWSVQILFDDLQRLYDHPEEALAPLEVSFRDYQLAEIALQDSTLVRRSRDYWDEQLPLLPEAPQLPLTKAPSEVTRPRFVRRSSVLEAPVWRRLKARAAEAGLTPSGVLLAAFGEILAQWGRSPAVTLNVTTFRRLPMHPDVQRMIGDFTSLTMVSVDSSEMLPFRERALRTQDRLWQHLDNRLVSGVELLRELARLQGRPPGALMPVVFTSLLTRYDETEAAPAEGETENRDEYRQVYAVSQTPQVWLDHQVMEDRGALRWNWDAVEELFPSDLLDDMFATYENLLRSLASSEEAWRAEPRALLPAAQLARRDEVNATELDIPVTTLDALFTERAALQPEAPAVFAGETVLSYGELAVEARRVRNWLLEHGAEPNQLIAVVMEKGWEQVAAALGVLQAGAAYLPIDAHWPKERRDLLLEEGQVRLVLTQQALLDNEEWLGDGSWPEDIVCAAVGSEAVAAAPEMAGFEPRHRPEDLAYVIFTSGSTGRPKGVAVEHRAAVNTILDINERFHVGPKDRVLSLSALNFDLSVYDLFGMLAAGGAVVLPEAAALRDPARWSDLIAEHEVTVWNSVPALLELLVDHADGRAGEAGAIAPALRLALLSGDWLPVNIADRLRRYRPECEVISLGGATEAAIWSIFYPIGEVGPEWTSIPYGTPLANQSFHVLDSNLEPRPVWVPGELYIGGAGLAREYWRDGEKTAASFILHPRTGERLYRTGDLGRYLPDGNIEFLGREDAQVKIQGYRIELGEIEAVLEEHPAVANAAVAVAGEDRTQRRLVGFYVPAEGTGEEVDAEALKSHAAAKLPAYMVPALLAPLAEIPLTANGKIDRKALAQLAGRATDELAATSADRAPPRTPLEEELVELWRELLNVPQMGIDDHLFDLGGNSLVAIQMLSRLRETFRVDISLRDLFDNPTVAGLASLIALHKAGGGETGRELEDERLVEVVLDPANRHEPFPLNDVQQAYFLGRMGSLELGNVAAHSYLELEIQTERPERIQTAWRRLIDRHDMLRAIFLPDGRQQVLAEVPDFEIPLTDLTEAAPEAAERHLRQVRDELSHQVLQADRWPLFDLRISRLATDRIRLHISFDLLIADAWSSQILLREFSHFVDFPDTPLPPLELTFRDYTLGSEALEQSGAYLRSRDYWQRRVADMPPAPELPLAKDPASVETPIFLRRSGRLDSALWERLQERASRTGLTPSGLVLAAFAEVLGGWSAAPRFTVNVTTFNRLPVHPQINEVVGDFTSLSLLAVDGGQEENFEMRSRRVQEQLWEDLDHRHYSGVRVVRELARAQGRAPGALMPVVFTSRLFRSNEPAQDTQRDQGAEPSEMVYSVSQTPQVWLDMQVSEEAGQLVWTWDAVEELFPDRCVDSMFAAFHRLLSTLAEKETAWTQRAFLLAPAEQLAIREEINATEAPVQEVTLHALFADQVRRDPERMAVADGEGVLTYADVAARAEAVARRLRTAPPAEGELVAVVLEKGWRQVVATLGILGAGGAYLPVDPDWPAERRAYLLENGRARWVVTQRSLAEELEWPEGVQLLIVEDQQPAELGGSFLDTPVAPDQLAYVIFTSGSTGQPKGVAIEHRSAANTILDVNRRFGLTAEDRVFALSALNFDLSVYDLFGTLAAGAAIVFPDAGTQRDPSHWATRMREHNVSVWNSVPALLELLLEHADGNPEALPETLRVALLSGDWLPVNIADRLRRHRPAAEVVSLGGATEASIWSILYPIREVETGRASIPYGKPMINQSFHVLNHRLRPCPEWVPGELFIGGIGLAREYWRDAEKTAASFITHPDTGERLYRTGDLGRYLPDGNIEFLGRRDTQVKIQGYRIELGEIEAALARDPRIAAQVVAAPLAPSARGNRGARRLVAYVVPKDGEPLDTAALRADLEEVLPAYMVPSLFIELDALPLSANGKVDRSRLPAPDGPSAAGEAAQAVRTPLERQLAALWSELLDVSEVNIEDNLFDLGGNSLVAIQMVTRIREEFGVEISIASLFDHLTVASLAQVIAQRRAAGDPDARLATQLPTLEADLEARHEPFPLNDVQQAYWVGRLNIFALGNVAAHSYTEVERRDFDPQRFTAAFRRLIDRHDALRLIFLKDGRQQILKEVPPYEVQTIDLRQASADEIDRSIEKIRLRMSHQVLPADRWPLFEVRATLLPDGVTRLHLSFDLLIADAWSSTILFQELTEVMEDPSGTWLAPLEISYRDYVMAEEKLRTTELYRRSESYWRSRLATLPPAPELPLRGESDENLSGRFTRLSASLSEEEWRVLRQRAGEIGVTDSGLLMGAFSEVLGAWSKSPRFTLNLTTFNRLPLHPQVNQLMGDFTSLTLLEVDTSPLALAAGQDTFALRTRRLQEQLWQDLDHRHVSGIKVMRDLARDRGRPAAVLMPVVFTSRLFGGASAPQEEAEEGRENEVVYSVSQTPQVWLDHQVTDQGEGLSWTWDVVDDLFPEGVVEAMFTAYRNLLRTLASDAESWQRPVPAMVPAPQLERRASVNDTAAPLSGDLIHTLFDRQAEAAPTATAVVAASADGSEQSLTYGALREQARGVGAWLLDHGATANQLVAIVMEKGCEQAIAALGVLYSGAAYVPIDPALPEARIAQLLDSSGAGQILTTEAAARSVEWPDNAPQARLLVDLAIASGTLPSPREPEVPVRPEDLAYVIFTSGSTGQPKGVAIEHRSAVNTLVDVNRRFQVTAEDRVLGLSSLNFDLSVYDLFGIFAAGGSLVLPAPGTERDPDHWTDLLVRHGVTLWNSVPAFLEMLVTALEGRQHADAPVSTLRQVFLSGDRIPVGLPGRLRAFAPDVEVISLGGATEAAIWSIFHPIGELDPSWKSIPYGKPLANQAWEVLDAQLRPRPDWVPGHLYITGEGLARGYWRDEARTAAAFLTLGEGEEARRLYRTGDLGRYHPDGTLELLGRDDDQVKIQGYRVELGEIESVLNDHAAVNSAVVLAPEVEGDDPSAHPRRLIAFIAGDKAPAEPAPAAAAPAEDPWARRPEPVFDPVERLQFKLARHGLRKDLASNGEAEQALLGPAVPDDGALRRLIAQRTVRNFRREAIAPETLGRLLRHLGQVQPQGVPLPKYRYPSGGGLYPVQTYLHVRAGAVEGLAPGIYYFHPRKQILVPLVEADIDLAGLHAPENRSVAEGAAFTLFFVGHLAAVSPLYPEMGRDFCVLEAGYMAQLLRSEAPELDLGLCPVGGLDFGSVRGHFGLEPTDELVHVLLGGPVAAHPGSVQDAFLAEQADPPAAKAPIELPADPGESKEWTVNGVVERRDWTAGAVFDPLERLEFKFRQQGLRDLPGAAVPLPPSPLAPAEEETLWTSRRSYHHYQDEVIPLEDFATWLGCLRQVQQDGAPLPKALYPSGGGLYPVQTYLHVKEGRIEGLKGGTWYYDPAEHRLVLLEEGVEIDRSLHGPPNQPVHDEAAFSVFLTARPAAVSPLYPMQGRDFCLLEAGYMGQLMMMEGFARRIGLTPLGGMGFEPVKKHFRLSEDDTLIHAFVGGRVPGMATFKAIVEEQQSDAKSLAADAPSGAPPPVDPAARQHGAMGRAHAGAALSAPQMLPPQAFPGAGPEELRSYLGARLPAYMVPATFLYMDRFPLTANGKVDRAALARRATLANEPVPQATPYKAPETDAEKIVAGLWQDVLGLSKVGRDQNFFELGGTSVNVVQIHNRIQDLFQREIPIAELFEHPTIRTLAEHLATDEAEDTLEESRRQATERRAARSRRRRGG